MRDRWFMKTMTTIVQMAEKGRKVDFFFLLQKRIYASALKKYSGPMILIVWIDLFQSYRFASY